MTSPLDPPPSADSDEQERTLRLLLAVVLAVGLGVRLWMAMTLPPYFDDRYVANNIVHFLDGWWQPKHTYYGTLSYLPQALLLKACDALHSRTGIAALAVRGEGVLGLTPGALHIARTVVVAYSLLSVLMIYRVGRRLFSPAAGALAAAILAAYPHHLRSSIQLKPDMLALLLTLVTLYWTAGAARSPRLSRFLLAGVGVGLATSAKYTGVASCLPLTVWALWTGFRDRRRWAWLVLAGLAAVATYFALNPFAHLVLYYAPRLFDNYAGRARLEGSGHLTVLSGEVVFLASEHGWILGAFLLLGAALLLRRLFRRSESAEWSAAFLPLSLCLGFPAVEAAGMTLFRRQNLMPAMAGTALVCAYGAVRCGHWLAGRRPVARRPAAVHLAWLLPVYLLVRPFDHAYTQVVPDTWTVAENALRAHLDPLRARHVAYEPEGVAPEELALELAERWMQPATTAVPSLAGRSPAELDLADAEIFPLAKTRGPDAAFYQSRRRRLRESCARDLRPQPFRRRGRSLVLLLHPWTPVGDPIPLDVERSDGAAGPLAGRLPAGLAAGEVLSLELVRPEPEEESGAGSHLQVGDQPLPLSPAGERRHEYRFLTPRFLYRAGVPAIEIPGSEGADPSQFRLRLWRWSSAPEPCLAPPGGAGVAGGAGSVAP